MEYDVFISHSSHDKDSVALPLAEALEGRGLKVWLDKEQLHIGDSIRRGLDDAIKGSRFGVVILSPSYLESEWGQKELDAFFAKEKYQQKSILPIYHDVEVEDVERHWPLLADKISLDSKVGMASIAESIQRSIQGTSGGINSIKTFKRKYSFWPDNNWQWLIALGVAVVLGVLPFIITSTPSVSHLSQLPSMTVNNSNSINNSGTILGNVNQINIIVPSDEDISKVVQQYVPKTELSEGNEEKEVIETALKSLRQLTSDDLKQRIVDNLVNKKPQEAIKLWEVDLTKRSERNLSDPNLKALSKEWVDIGNIAYISGSSNVTGYYEKALELDPENDEAWNRLGLTQQRLGHLDEALNAFQRLLGLSKAKDNVLLEAIAYGNLGLVSFDRTQLDDAELYYGKSLEIFKSENRKSDVANQYNNLGLVYLTLNKLTKAEEYFHAALDIDFSEERVLGQVRAYNNIGSSYVKNGDWSSAIPLHEKALKISEENNWTEEIAVAYSGLGLAYRKMGGRENLVKAEEFYRESLQLETSLRRVEGMAIDEGNLGLIYVARQKLPKACNHFAKSFDLYKKIESADAEQLQQLINAHCQ